VKIAFQLGVLILRGERLGPVQREVEVAAAVVDAADFSGRGDLLFSRNLPVASSRVPARTLAFGFPKVFAEVVRARRPGRGIHRGNPSGGSFSATKLLDVFRCGAAGAGFEEAAAVHERNDGEHFGAGAEFEDGKEVRQIVAQDVAGDGDGVLAFLDPLQAELGRLSAGGRMRMSRARGVVILQVGFHLGDDLGVVGRVFSSSQKTAGRVGGASAG